MPCVADAAPSTSLTWVIVVKSTVVLAGSNVSPELPLDARNCTETKPTRYARKLSGDAVLVIVTTAVPLQPWSASKAAYQAGGITEKAYVDKCRAGETVAIPAVPPAAPPAATPASAPAGTPAATPAAKPAPAAKPSPAAATAAATGANEFPQEALAKAHCPTDTVVWANLESKIYHFSGTKSFGTTKEGAYMCEKDALGQGVRAAKNEKHP